jgi:hypothetical protein
MPPVVLAAERRTHSVLKVDPEKGTGWCAQCEGRMRVYRVQNGVRKNGEVVYRWKCSRRKPNARKRPVWRHILDENQECSTCGPVAVIGGKCATSRYEVSSKRLYGLSPEGYLLLLAQQNGVCAICEMPCRSRRRLSVDHDHVTGKIRGLLCTRCNMALGQFDDNSDHLAKAFCYLRAHEE